MGTASPSAEVGRDRVAPARLGTADSGKSNFPGCPTEGGSAVAPPPRGRASSALCHPRHPAGGPKAEPARPGAPGVGPQSGRCAASSRACALGLPPRESESAGPAKGELWGRGRRGPGTGAGHSPGHGRARPPPPSQPETEARPRGLVLGWGAGAAPTSEARPLGWRGWGRGELGAGGRLRRQSEGH